MKSERFSMETLLLAYGYIARGAREKETLDAVLDMIRDENAIKSCGIPGDGTDLIEMQADYFDSSQLWLPHYPLFSMESTYATWESCQENVQQYRRELARRGRQCQQSSLGSTQGRDRRAASMGCPQYPTTSSWETPC